MSRNSPPRPLQTGGKWDMHHLEGAEDDRAGHQEGPCRSHRRLHGREQGQPRDEQPALPGIPRAGARGDPAVRGGRLPAVARRAADRRRSSPQLRAVERSYRHLPAGRARRDRARPARRAPHGRGAHRRQPHRRARPRGHRLGARCQRQPGGEPGAQHPPVRRPARDRRVRPAPSPRACSPSRPATTSTTRRTSSG